MTGGSSHHHGDGRFWAAWTADTLIPSTPSRSKSSSPSSTEPWYSGPATSSQAPANVAQAITSCIRPACQYAGPDASRRPPAAVRLSGLAGGEPDGEAVPGADQRGVQAEHPDEPEPGSVQSWPGPRGGEPRQRVSGSRAGVVNTDQHPLGRGPDPD